MKTTFRLENAIIHVAKLFTFLIVSSLLMISCDDDDKDLITLPTSVEQASPADDYVGQYFLKGDDCGFQTQGIRITKIRPVKSVHDGFTGTEHSVYVENLLGSATGPVEASWTGGAYVISRQMVRMQQQEMFLSARIYSYQDQLTIDYQLSDNFGGKRCAATFQKN